MIEKLYTWIQNLKIRFFQRKNPKVSPPPPPPEPKIVPKFKVGDKVGCAICVPINRPLKKKDMAEILLVRIPSPREAKMGSHIRYMVRYPSGFIDWISEGVARV